MKNINFLRREEKKEPNRSETTIQDKKSFPSQLSTSLVFAVLSESICVTEVKVQCGKIHRRNHRQRRIIKSASIRFLGKARPQAPLQIL